MLETLLQKNKSRAPLQNLKILRIALYCNCTSTMEKKKKEEKNHSRCYSGSATHIVLHQVRVVLLDSIIQD